MKLNRILITGGAGFIGSHLCAKLLDSDCKVFCLDNLSTGSVTNLKNIINNKNFHFINQDVIFPFDFEVDEIYNFASPASPIQYKQIPIDTLKANIIGSINGLDLANKYKCKILQASTSEVYGNPLVHPQKESYLGNVNQIGKRACYDESKRCAETIFFDYNRLYDVSIKIIRIFNTYGENMSLNDGRVISNFIVAALQNKPITINGTGSQTRSFCYIEDLIDGIISIMKTKKSVIGPINLGCNQEIEISLLAELIIKLTNSKSNIVFSKMSDDDPIKRKPDLTIAKNIINWKPKTSLEEGLMKTILYFKKIISK